MTEHEYEEEYEPSCEWFEDPDTVAWIKADERIDDERDTL